MSQIQAVIFDMDGVLIDSEAVYLQWMLEFVRSKRPNTRIEELYPVVGQAPEPAWEIVRKLLETEESWQSLRKQYYKDWYPDSDHAIDYRRIFRPQAAELLKELKQKGYPIGLASSTAYDKIVHILNVNEIYHYFDVILSGQDLPKSKPDPAIYLKAAALLSCCPKQCMVLEDSTVGIQAALAAGMQVTALIDDRFSFRQELAHHRIRELKEFMQFVY